MSNGKGKSLSLGNRILIGVAAGIALGIFLGELASPFDVIGHIYVGLLQMTVLPFVAVSLVAKIGGLTLDQARRLAGRAGIVMLALWVLSLGAVLVLPFSLPEWKAGTFFSASLVETPEKFDFLGLYLPTNPFHSLANNVVPAVVVFSILLGVALIRVAKKDLVLAPLNVLGTTLSNISNFVVRLAPWGTFALTAGAAGRLAPAELARVIGYISSYTFGVVLLTFVVLPGFVAALTPFRYRQLMTGFREAGLTAFATGKLFAVLPMVIESSRKLLVGQGVAEEDAETAADVYVPLAYPFPNAGKILAILFIPFAAWFVGQPLSLADFPMLLMVGLLAFFGSPVAAVPFLLQLMHLPDDLFPLFLVAGIWCARLGDVLGAMHLMAFTLLCSSWQQGWLRLHTVRLGFWAGYVTAIGVVVLLVNHAVVGQSLAGQEPPRSLIERMDLTEEAAEITVEEQASPNPSPLRPGETRLERIRRTKVLRVGYVPYRAPFCFRNANGKLVGFDVDLVQRLARDLNTSLQLVRFERDGLTGSFASDHFDIAIGGIASSIEYFGRYHEAGPYLNLHIAFVVADDRVEAFRSLRHLRQLDGVRIGFVSTGHLARTGRHRFPGLEAVQLPSREAFVRGEVEVDALLTTAEAGAVIAMLYPEYSVVVPQGSRARVPVVFAVQVADELDRLLDRWLRLKREDGTIEELYAHWILGQRAKGAHHRWSVIRDVFGWVD
jgi:Na+/H+-dicarboxylate symporter